MPTEHAAKQIGAAFFLVAGGFALVNALINRTPLEEWGLTILLLLLGIVFLVWLWFDRARESAAPERVIHEEAAIIPAVKAAIVPAAPPASPTPAPVATQPEPAIKATPVSVPEPVHPAAEIPVEAPGPIIADAQGGEPVAEKKVGDTMAAPPTHDEPQIVPQAPVAEPDDLTRVEGIGPKYRDALVAAGIDTFGKLADTSPEGLEKVIRDAGMRRPASMVTWQAQAALAARNDWAALAELQSQLKGGRPMPG